MLNLGLTFYDAASGEWRKRRHRMLNARQVLAREPHLNPSGLRGAGMYYDVLTDDARFTVELAKGAAEAGAQLINHAEVTGLVLERGIARGVTIHDNLKDEDWEVHARQVLNATGPWTDRTRALEHSGSGRRLRPTKGVHIVVRKVDFPLETPVFLRSPDDGRVVWPTPSLEQDVVYIGTTDTDYGGDLDDVHPDDSDITYLLNVANQTIPEAHLDESHVVGSWAGLRPPVAPAPGVSESNTSREHEISVGPTGMLTISGGKFTSNRLMAQQFVDAAERALKTSVRQRDAATTPLPGSALDEVPAIAAAARSAGVPAPASQAWIHRYGSNAGQVLDRWRRSDAARRELGVRGLTVAEIEYAVEEEMVASLSDLLVRRTSIFFWDADGGIAQIAAIADVLAQLLNWTEDRRRAEIETYRALVDKHRPSAGR
jgi:glycerol-3-phosphate dehydrogenase